MKRQELARYLDHTLLKADATTAEIDRLVEEAIQWDTYAVCVNSGYTARVRDLRGDYARLHIAATVGFPLGQAATDAKVAETRAAIASGADEIDLVWNLGLFLSEQFEAVTADIREVVSAAGPVPVKVILETARLDAGHMAHGAHLAVAAGAHTVKTSTGFGFPGATVDAVKTLRQAVGPNIGVKASGGIRTYDDAIAMIEAGATRIGLSQTVAVLKAAPI